MSQPSKPHGFWSRALNRPLVIAFALAAAASVGCSVDVNAPFQSTALQSLAIDQTALTLTIGDKQALTATGSFSDGSTAKIITDLTWLSSDASVATVTAGGVVSALAAGTVTITVRKAGVSATATATVVTASLSSVAISPATVSIVLHETSSLTLTGSYSDHTTRAITDGVVWSSADDSIATVTQGGMVTGAAVGATTVTATVGTLSSTVPVTVGEIPCSGVTLSDTQLTLATGATKQITATGRYGSEDRDVTTAAEWSTSSETVATVSAGGLVTAVGVGQAFIRATVGTKTAALRLTVVAAGP